MVKIEVSDNFFTPKEKEKLKSILQLKDERELLKAIEKLAYASLSEYKDMLLNIGLPSRVDDIQQRRLFYVIKHYYADKLPSETEISLIFQLPTIRSKNLLRLVLTKFRNNLKEEIANTLKSTIDKARKNDEKDYYLSIESDSILEELNRIIAAHDPSLKPIRKVRDMSRTYSISEDSYDAFRKYLGLE